MSDITTTVITPADQEYLLTRPSFWGKSLDFVTLNADPTRWNQEWEGLLVTLSPQKAFVVMGRAVAQKGGKTNLEGICGIMKDDIRKMQGVLVGLWRTPALKDHLITAWMLLGPQEKERRLLEGFKEASKMCPFRQEARSLCPEIRTSLLLAHSGRAFTDLVEKYIAAKEAMDDSTIPYLFPSAWWDRARDDVPDDVLDMLDASAFMILTLLRNMFIARFIGHSITSLGSKLVRENSESALHPISKLMKEEPIVAKNLAYVASSQLEKPLIRCENCTKSQEDIGHDVQFMFCSVCKRKLQFEVHYCSVDCQKQDWPLHKKNCGKQKVSKKLKGTVHDPHWKYPFMTGYRRVETATPDGIPVYDTGFGPASAVSSYLPALQRQVTLLRADTQVDYFLFDTYDRPIRFVIPDSDVVTKMAFRWSRSDALGPREEFGVECIAEYIIKIMENHPGISRELILAQFRREYGNDVDVEGGIARLNKGAASTSNPEHTFVEGFSRLVKVSEAWAESADGQILNNLSAK